MTKERREEIKELFQKKMVRQINYLALSFAFQWRVSEWTGRSERHRPNVAKNNTRPRQKP